MDMDDCLFQELLDELDAEGYGDGALLVDDFGGDALPGTSKPRFSDEMKSTVDISLERVLDFDTSFMEPENVVIEANSVPIETGTMHQDENLGSSLEAWEGTVLCLEAERSEQVGANSEYFDLVDCLPDSFMDDCFGSDTDVLHLPESLIIANPGAHGNHSEEQVSAKRKRSLHSSSEINVEKRKSSGSVLTQLKSIVGDIEQKKAVALHPQACTSPVDEVVSLNATFPISSEQFSVGGHAVGIRPVPESSPSSSCCHENSLMVANSAELETSDRGGPRSSGDDENNKKVRRLMRNRASASESRQRRKSYVMDLESKCRALESQVNSLRQVASISAMENGMLRDQLMRLHNLCNSNIAPVELGRNQSQHLTEHQEKQANVEKQSDNTDGNGERAEPAVLESNSLPLEFLLLFVIPILLALLVAPPSFLLILSHVCLCPCQEFPFHQSDLPKNKRVREGKVGSDMKSHLCCQVEICGRPRSKKSFRLWFQPALSWKSVLSWMD